MPSPSLENFRDTILNLPYEEFERRIAHLVSSGETTLQVTVSDRSVEWMTEVNRRDRDRLMAEGFRRIYGGMPAAVEASLDISLVADKANENARPLPILMTRYEILKGKKR